MSCDYSVTESYFPVFLILYYIPLINSFGFIKSTLKAHALVKYVGFLCVCPSFKFTRLK